MFAKSLLSLLRPEEEGGGDGLFSVSIMCKYMNGRHLISLRQYTTIELPVSMYIIPNRYNRSGNCKIHHLKILSHVCKALYLFHDVYVYICKVPFSITVGYIDYRVKTVFITRGSQLKYYTEKYYPFKRVNNKFLWYETS